MIDDVRKPKFSMLIAFGLGILLVFGLVSGIFIAALTHISDYRDFGGFAFKALVVAAPVLSASIGIIQGMRSDGNGKAVVAGSVTGGLGYIMFYLGGFVPMAVFSYEHEAVDYVSQSISGFWIFFGMLVLVSAIVCALTALFSHIAFGRKMEEGYSEEF